MCVADDGMPRPRLRDELRQVEGEGDGEQLDRDTGQTAPRTDRDRVHGVHQRATGPAAVTASGEGDAAARCDGLPTRRIVGDLA